MAYVYVVKSTGDGEVEWGYAQGIDEALVEVNKKVDCMGYNQVTNKLMKWRFERNASVPFCGETTMIVVFTNTLKEYREQKGYVEYLGTHCEDKKCRERWSKTAEAIKRVSEEIETILKEKGE